MQVLSFDLDDTLWPVGPVIEAAEQELFAWLQRAHPAVVHGHSIASMRELRAAVATQYPGQAHDLTFLRREALVRQFSAAGHDIALADHALEVFLTARNRVDLYPDVRPALERLKARQCRPATLWARTLLRWACHGEKGRGGKAGCADLHALAGGGGCKRPGRASRRG